MSLWFGVKFIKNLLIRRSRLIVLNCEHDNGCGFNVNSKLYSLSYFHNAAESIQNYYLLFQYNRIINDMLIIYNDAKICAYQQPFNCELRLQPHIKEVRT